MRLDLKEASDRQNDCSTAVYLIDLPQDMMGFRKFISSWVVLTKDYNFLVDVGPSSTIPVLIKKMESLGVNLIDYVFLTHIHLDHAGGIGHLIERFPKLKVVAHEKSKSHLLNPEIIWEGSKKTLGEVAVKYGEIKPVPLENLVDGAGNMVKIIDTPGHAAHHLSFQFQDILFAGEAGGVYLNGLNENEFYLRPATPPRFFFETANSSLDKLLALNAEKICYGHYGFARDANKMLNFYRNQIFLWKDIIKTVIDESIHKSNEEIALLSFKKLLKEDRIFAGYLKLDKDIQQRERYFVLNSIKGFLGYLRREQD
jgi:glyoxylase-like metal-dependent hydrolase (beta-lactamase superfamily II)